MWQRGSVPLARHLSSHFLLHQGLADGKGNGASLPGRSPLPSSQAQGLVGAGPGLHGREALFPTLTTVPGLDLPSKNKFQL